MVNAENSGTPARPLADGEVPFGFSAYQKIRDAIVSGVLAPGTPLVEAAVAEWCGVSRTPAREALARLEQDALLTRADKGLIVRERSPEEVLDLYDNRIVLEASAARLAAVRHTSFDVIRLEKALLEGERVQPDDPDDKVIANRKFHRAVWHASHNESLVDLLDRLNLHLVKYPATTLTFPGRWSEGLTQHREVVEAIRERQPEQAAEAARRHFQAARDIRLRLWATEDA